jgi:undecaprenyl-diphosphatase
MIGVEMWRRKRMGAAEIPLPDSSTSAGKSVEDMTWMDALKIGFLQVLAMWPGTSRSMMTITGGYFAGLRPAAAAEFSFLLGMPTLLAATGLALVKDLLKAHKEHTPTMFDVLGVAPIVVGIVVAAVCAAVAVKWLVGFLNRHGLTAFGVYRICFGVALIALVMAGLVTVAK